MAKWNEAEHPRGRGEHGGEWIKKLSDAISGGDPDEHGIQVGVAVKHQHYGQGIVHKVNGDGTYNVKFATQTGLPDGMKTVPFNYVSYGNKQKLKVMHEGKVFPYSEPHGLPTAGASSRAFPSIGTLNASDAEVKAVLAYTNGNEFYTIQDSLRHGNGSDPNIKHIDALIDRSPPTKKAVMVQREIGMAHPGATNPYTVEQVFGPVGSRVGQIFTDNGYTSTTSGDRFQYSDMHGWAGGKHAPDGKAALQIKIPKGTKAFKPDKHGKYIKEKEVLLPRGSKFKITKDYVDFQGLRRIEMEMQ
jgi:hypothetical protein